jgi:hypothetical protein
MANNENNKNALESKADDIDPLARSMSPEPIVRHPTRPDTPVNRQYMPNTLSDSDSDDKDLPSVPPSPSPDPLDIIDQGFMAKTNIAVCHAALLLPQTFAQAHSSPHWPDLKQALLDEINKLERYKVWEVVDNLR